MGDPHVCEPVGHGLEAANGDPELLAREGVFGGAAQQLAHGAHGLGREKHNGVIDDLTDQCLGVAREEPGLGPVEVQMGSTATVDGDERGGRQSRAVRLDGEQGKPSGVSGGSAEAGRDEQHVGLCPMEHQLLLSGQGVAGTPRLGTRGDQRRIWCTRSLLMGEGADGFTGDDGVEAARVAAVRRRGEQAASEHHGGEVGLNQEMDPEQLADRDDVDDRSAVSANVFGERKRDQFEFTQALPDLRGPARVGVDHGLTSLEVVVAPQVPDTLSHSWICSAVKLVPA